MRSKPWRAVLSDWAEAREALEAAEGRVAAAVRRAIRDDLPKTFGVEVPAVDCGSALVCVSASDGVVFFSERRTVSASPLGEVLVDGRTVPEFVAEVVALDRRP